MENQMRYCHAKCNPERDKWEEAEKLVKNGCICVSEGANMPSTPEAIEVFLNARSFMAREKQPMPEAWQRQDWK